MTTGSPSAVAAAPQRRLLSSALSLSVRQVLVAVLTGVGVLVLSHMLTPSQFAFFGWTTAVATFASAVGDLGYGAALIHSGRARALAARAMARHVQIVIPVAVVVALAIVALPLSGATRGAALLLTLAAALLGAQMLPTSVFEAEGRFAFIGAVEVLQRGVLIGVAVALAAIDRGAWNAPAACVAAAAFGLGTALVTSRVRLLRREDDLPAQAASVDDSFARSWLIGRAANHLNYALYPIIGTAFLSGHDLGLVLWALQVSAVPALGGQVVARVLFPAIVGDPERKGPETHRRAVSVLVATGGPVVSAMIVFAHPVTLLVFGSSWLGAVTVLQIECANTLLGLVMTPTAPAMYVFAPPQRVRTVMVANTALTAILAIALIGPVGLTAISIATAASSIATLAVFDRLLRRHGHAGLMFVMPMAVVLTAVTALGLVWGPSVHNLALLIVVGGAWTLVVFALLVALTRPSIPWDRARLRRRGGLTCV